jgi:catechol 2,3-dioxygenase-like lactoylglutathione lyase family enzyme
MWALSRGNSCAIDDLDLFAPDGCSMNWILSEALEQHQHTARFPLSAFNHIARECVDLEKTKNFYCSILGFMVIPRPPFDVDGFWLHGNGLNLHLIPSKHANKREKLRNARIRHFTRALPTVDHIAFLTTDINAVRAILDEEKVYYKYEEPAKCAGIKQIFVFDPDGNVVEISNCAPPVGEVSCVMRDPSLRGMGMLRSMSSKTGLSPAKAPMGLGHHQQFSRAGSSISALPRVPEYREEETLPSPGKGIASSGVFALPRVSEYREDETMPEEGEEETEGPEAPAAGDACLQEPPTLDTLSLGVSDDEESEEGEEKTA